MEAKNTRLLEVVKILYEKAELMFFTFSIMDVWRHVNKMGQKIIKKSPMINLMHIS